MTFSLFLCIVGFHPSFSRHGKVQTSLTLLIWLNENVQRLYICLLTGWAYT